MNLLKRSLLGLVCTLILPIMLISGCTTANETDNTSAFKETAITESEKPSEAETELQKTETATEPVTESETETEQQNGDMAVHFLDVGQGLAILVQSGGQNLIYDGGDRGTSSFVVSYLQKQGITDIDYLISSHYDADHLAGLIGCLNAFEVHNVIGSDYEHDSKTYLSFMNTVDEQGLSVQHPAVGTEFQFGTGKFTVLAPSEIVSESNANSVVIKLENGDNSFIFTGDADQNSEAVMCAAGLDLDCDVLSIGHHGSATCTSYEFLQATVPEIAVISCGADNQYGHPHKDVMDRLESMEIDVFRSDEQGTIIATSDGSEITWNAEPCNDYSPGDESDDGTVPQNDDPEETTAPETVATEAQTQAPVVEEPADTGVMVWKSATGSKYHSIPNCGNMNPDKATQITQSQAEAQGLGRCSNCW